MRLSRPLCAMALAVAGFACLSAAAEDKVGVGSPAPTFLLPTINAQDCGLQRAGVEPGAPGDGAGRPRAYLVSFFSVDCKPCRHELPQLKNIHRELAAQGLAVVVVGVDAPPEKIAEAQKLVAELALPFPVVRDRFQVVQRRYQVDTLPTLFVIDERNVVRLRIVGYDPKTSLPVEELKKALSASGAQRR